MFGCWVTLVARIAILRIQLIHLQHNTVTTGFAALMEYFDSHIQYPPEAAKNNIQGRVILQFVVDKKGKVDEVKVVRSVDKDLDKEAVRLIKTLPKFTPGRQNGQTVAVWYTLPITFKLPKENHNN